MSFFVAGTDTGVGKTHVTAMLLRALRQAGHAAVGFKPICCGGREDAETLLAAAPNAASLNEINPVWLRPPAAPYVAAMIEGRTVDLALIRDTFQHLRRQYATLLVEGAGGWLVPVAPAYSMADLAVELALPVIIVSANRLGALNHTLLTVRAVRASGLVCAGVILNQAQAPEVTDPAALTNREILGELLTAEGVPLLGEIEHGTGELPSPVLAKILPLLTVPSN